MGVSQRQVAIKLTGKTDLDKQYIINWKPISLLNGNVKCFKKLFCLCEVFRRKLFM